MRGFMVRRLGTVTIRLLILSPRTPQPSSPSRISSPDDSIKLAYYLLPQFLNVAFSFHGILPPIADPITLGLDADPAPCPPAPPAPPILNPITPPLAALIPSPITPPPAPPTPPDPPASILNPILPLFPPAAPSNPSLTPPTLAPASISVLALPTPNPSHACALPTRAAPSIPAVQIK
ncbi:hypothetical protein Tco_0015561 [Tanacetum coccineum]